MSIDVVIIEKRHTLLFSPDESDNRFEATALVGSNNVIRLLEGKVIRAEDGLIIGSFTYKPDGQLAIWVDMTEVVDATSVLAIMQNLQSFIYAALTSDQY